MWQCFLKSCFRYVLCTSVFQRSSTNNTNREKFLLHIEDKIIHYFDILEALYFSNKAHNATYSRRNLSMFALYINTMFLFWRIDFMGVCVKSTRAHSTWVYVKRKYHSSDCSNSCVVPSVISKTPIYSFSLSYFYLASNHHGSPVMKVAGLFGVWWFKGVTLLLSIAVFLINFIDTTTSVMNMLS